MAKKKKTRKKARTANRLDYTKGGRVGYRPGGRVPGEPGAPLPQAVRPSERGRQTPPAPVVTTGEFNVPQSELDRAEEERQKAAEEAARAANKAAKDAQQAAEAAAQAATTTTVQTSADVETRRQELAEQAMQPVEPFEPKTIGEVVGQEAMEAAVLKGEGTQIAEEDVTKVAGTFIDTPEKQAVSLIDEAPQIAAPEQIQAPTVEAVQAGVAEVDAATGEVRPEALVERTDVTRVEPIEGAEVEIKEGAIAERLEAQMSPEAIAEAAEVSGLDVRRVTRAKEELRNAGIDDLTISQLGNDPKALEEALMELTDEERGLVAGLPEEALVSNQMDTLLKGIEEGEIPAWARPAVAAVEATLAARGLSASSVGRDALLNTIIQSAIPIAQSNATAIQKSIQQERGIEAQVAIEDAKFRQQTALTNANNVFRLDLAQFNADQQTNLTNSRFLQTVSITEANNEQQATLQNAALLSQANLAEANLDQQRLIKNAQAFMQMDLANLNNEQQASIIKAQNEQQALLSNQAAENAARQLNARNELQVQEFMASLAADIDKTNAVNMLAMKEFNANALNVAASRDADRQLEVAKYNAMTRNQIEQFNAAVDNNRLEFNKKNSLLIEQSNVEWQRKINTAETAATNASVEMAAKMNFDLTAQAQASYWQDMRDQASFIFDQQLADQSIAAKLTSEFLAGQYNDKEAMNKAHEIMKNMINKLTEIEVT